MPNSTYPPPEPGIFVDGIFIPERIAKLGPVHYDDEDVWTCKSDGFRTIGVAAVVRHLQQHQDKDV
jgi:hypothetical protein